MFVKLEEHLNAKKIKDIAITSSPKTTLEKERIFGSDDEDDESREDDEDDISEEKSDSDESSFEGRRTITIIINSKMFKPKNSRYLFEEFMNILEPITRSIDTPTQYD